MAPTREQLIANIKAMESQGAKQPEIQKYLDQFKGQHPPLTPDQTQSALATVSSANKDNFGMRVLKGLGNITGATAIGEELGTTALNIGRLVQGQNPDIPVNIPRLAGGILQAGATVGSLGANPATLAESIGTFGFAGAAESGGKAMTEGKSPIEIAKKAFVGGLTGAGIGVAGYGLQQGFEEITSKGPTALYNNALRISKKIKAASESPSGFLADENVWGSLGSMSKQVQTGMSEESATINQAAVNTAGGITYDEVKNKAIDFLSKGKLGDLYNNEELQALVDKVPVARMRDAKDIVPWVDANGVRSSLGSLIGDNKWLQANPTEVTQAHEAVYGALSDAIKKATGTQKNFFRFSNWVRANKALNNAIDVADSKWGLGLMDTVSGGVGAISGALIGQPVVGAALGVGAERAVKSPAVQTGLAQALSRLPVVGGALGRATMTLGLGNRIGK